MKENKTPDCLSNKIHNWMLWIDVRQGSLYKRLLDGRIETVGYYINQERRCMLCGVKELRQIKI